MKNYVLFIVLIIEGFSLQAQERSYKHFGIDEGLPSNNVYKIIQDKHGYIWATTDNGVVRFDGKTFKRYTVFNGLSTNFNWGIYYDSNDRIWLGNSVMPINYIKNGKVHSVKSSLFDFKLKSICEDIEGNIYFNDKKNEVSYQLPVGKDSLVFFNHGIFLGETTKLIHYIRKEGYIVSYDKNEVIQDSLVFPKNYVIGSISQMNNDIYISVGSNIYLLKNDKLKLFYESDKMIYETCCINSGLTFAILFESENRLITLNQAGEEIELDLGDISYYSNALLDDNQGIWISSIGNGLRYYPYELEENRLISSQSIFSLQIVSDSCFYTTKNGGYLNQDLVYQIPINNSQKDLVTFKGLNFLFYDSKLIIGKDDQVFSRNKKSQKKLANLHSNLSINLQDIEERVIYFGIIKKTKIIDDKFYCATHRGLYGITLEDDLLNIERLCSGYVYAMGFIEDDVYVGNEYGLYKLSGGMKEPVFPSVLARTSIKSILKSTEEHLIIGTEHGELFEVNVIDSTIKKFDVQFDQIIDLSVAKESSILVSTTNGLQRFNLSTSRVEFVYQKLHGLPSLNIVKSVVNGDNIYVGTEAGLVKIKYQPKVLQSMFYPTYLVSAYSDSLELDVVEGEIQVPVQSDRLTLDFDNITYWGAENVKYKYRLKGKSDDWVISKNSVIEYLNFPEGDFIFELMTLGSMNVERQEVFSVKISKRKTFWKRNWFYFLEVLSAVLLFYLIYRIIQKRKRKKEYLRYKIAVAENKALRLQLNPHFLFNSLNTLQQHVLEQDFVSSNEYINNLSILMRNILNYSEKETITLVNELKVLNQFFEMEKDRIDQEIILELAISDKVDLKELLVPALIFQPIIENCIWYGLKNTKQKGLITLSLNVKDNYLIAQIVDNGQGNPKIDEKKSYLPSIENTRERLLLFDDSRRKRFEYFTKTEQKEKGKVKSTTVMIFIKEKRLPVE